MQQPTLAAGLSPEQTQTVTLLQQLEEKESSPPDAELTTTGDSSLHHRVARDLSASAFSRKLSIF